MTRRLWLLLFVLLGVVSAAVTTHVVQNYRFETVWRDRGPGVEARKNPYHAAEQFLRSRNVDTRVASVLPEIMDRLESTDTLMLFYDHDVEYQILRSRIEDWVRKGGHLVITVHYLWDEENRSSGDRFLDEMGVRQYLWPKNRPSDNDEAGTDTHAGDNAERGGNPRQGNKEGKQQAIESMLKSLKTSRTPARDAELLCEVSFHEPLARIRVPGSAQPLLVAFQPEYHIEDTSGEAHGYNEQAPVHMLEYRKGAGKITVLTDYFVFNDDNIGHYDHAFLLWWLTQESNRVWMVHDKDSDSLVALIWESAPYLVVAALLWLGGYLLYRGRRFGPARRIHAAPRRQLLEHIDASAAYLWRTHQAEHLVRDAREHVFDRFPGLMDNDALPLRLQSAAENADIPLQKLRWALTTPVIENEEDFIEITRLLQLIRMSL